MMTNRERERWKKRKGRKQSRKRDRNESWKGMRVIEEEKRMEAEQEKGSE